VYVLANAGMRAGSTPYQRLVNHPRIKRHHLLPLQYKVPHRALLAIYYPLKVILQLAQLMWTLLFTVSRPSFILVQVGVHASSVYRQCLRQYSQPEIC